MLGSPLDLTGQLHVSPLYSPPECLPRSISLTVLPDTGSCRLHDAGL